MKTLLAKLTIPLTTLCLAASAFGGDLNLGGTEGLLSVETDDSLVGFPYMRVVQEDSGQETELVLLTQGTLGSEIVSTRVLRLHTYQSLNGGSHGIAFGAVGDVFDAMYSATGSVNFGSTANDATNSATITVTGASTTNTPAVDIGGVMPSGWDLVQAYVSATDTVTVVGRNKTGSTNDPGAVTLRALVTQF